MGIYNTNYITNSFNQLKDALNIENESTYTAALTAINTGFAKDKFDNPYEKSNLEKDIITNLFSCTYKENENILYNTPISYNYTYYFSYENSYFYYDDIEENNLNSYLTTYSDIVAYNTKIHTSSIYFKDYFTSFIYTETPESPFQGAYLLISYSLKKPEYFGNNIPNSYYTHDRYKEIFKEDIKDYPIKNSTYTENTPYLHSYFFGYYFTYNYSYEYNKYSLNGTIDKNLYSDIIYSNGSYYMITLSPTDPTPEIQLISYTDRFYINNCSYIYFNKNLNNIRKVKNGRISLYFNHEYINNTQDGNTIENINEKINSYINNDLTTLFNSYLSVIESEIEKINSYFGNYDDLINTKDLKIITKDLKISLNTIPHNIDDSKLDDLLKIFNEYNIEG